MEAAARLEPVCGLLDRMTPADLAVLEPALMLSVRREYRLRQRDRAIILLAGEYLARFGPGGRSAKRWPLICGAIGREKRLSREDSG